MYALCWPASLGHSGLLLLPPGPWQAPQTAALPAPASALPPVNGSALPSAQAEGAATSTKCFIKAPLGILCAAACERAAWRPHTLRKILHHGPESVLNPPENP